VVTASSRVKAMFFSPASSRTMRTMLESRQISDVECTFAPLRLYRSEFGLLQFITEHGQMLSVAIACGWFLEVFHTVHLLSISDRNWLYSVERIEAGKTVDSKSRQ
jgi:hypothetical protein